MNKTNKINNKKSRIEAEIHYLESKVLPLGNQDSCVWWKVKRTKEKTFSPAAVALR